MTINQLENFIAVVESGSFSQAAEALFLSPQALIQKIARMEQELGFKLLVRTSKGVHVSPAGEAFYKTAKSIVSEYSEGIDHAAKLARQTSSLRIGLPESVNPEYLLSVCRLFSERHPEITLHYERLSRQDTVKALLKGKIDVGAQIRPDEETPFFSEKLFSVTHCCLMHRSCPLAQQSSIALSDLQGYTVGIWGPPEVYRNLSRYIHDFGLDIQLRSIQEDFSEALLFCMQDHILLASAPVVSYLKTSLAAVPAAFDVGLHYYLSYTQENNDTLRQFLKTAHEVAAAENHPWKRSLSNFPIDK